MFVPLFLLTSCLVPLLFSLEGGSLFLSLNHRPFTAVHVQGSTDLFPAPSYTLHLFFCRHLFVDDSASIAQGQQAPAPGKLCDSATQDAPVNEPGGGGGLLAQGAEGVEKGRSGAAATARLVAAAGGLGGVGGFSHIAIGAGLAAVAAGGLADIDGADLAA
ncbi:MAG: hypothetical protein P8X95_28525, partial [Anaerolineales bacterium]